jgi:dTDP-L-oleandrosyltransferase
MMINAFRNQPWEAVLSISGSLDRLSAIDPALFSDVPANVRLNCCSGNFDILENSCLYIGQGGQGGVLEAIFCGVPQIVVPPTPFHNSVARRVSELGLGLCLPISELSQDSLLAHVTTLLNDKETLHRVKEASNLMGNQLGAQLAVDAIEEYLI